MRLRRLDLLRYGHLTDVALDFPETAGLHVVRGANEAGKSTALAAIADALFGFRHRTDFDFLHGAPQLRIGFTLAAAAGGVETSFVRRKGNKDTLRDAAGQPVPETALVRFLGGAGRELFEEAFGLNGERLREGGRALLRAGGRTGETLLAAAGLPNLPAALEALDREARELVGDGRGRRRLAEAVEAWKAARRDVDELAVRPAAWKAATEAHGQAVAALREVHDTSRALAEERSRLERVRRTAPLLATLAGRRAELGLLTDAPRLPADAAHRLDELSEAWRQHGRDAEREAETVRRLGAECSALPLDEPVLVVQDAIDALDAQRPVVQQATHDLPKVRESAAAHRASVAAAIVALGLELAPEAARDQQPSAAARRTVRRLISRYGKLEAAEAGARRNRVKAAQHHEAAQLALAAAPEPPSPAPLRATIEAARAEGRLDTALADAERKLGAHEAAVAAGLAALSLWRHDIANLRACALPPAAEAAAMATQLAAADTALADARRKMDDLAGQIDVQEHDLSRLTQGAPVPTPDAVTAARAERDRVWGMLRHAYAGGEPSSAAEKVRLADIALPDAYEALRTKADRLADRRADEAQRVADFLATTDRLTLLRRQHTAATDAHTAADADATQAGDRWRALWGPAGLVPLTPQAMAEWRRARDALLDKADAMDSARHERDGLADRRDRALGALRALLPDAPATPMLAALLAHAEAACKVAEEANAAHHQCNRTLTAADATLKEQDAEARAAAADLAEWRREWVPAVAGLGLPEDADLDAAEAALNAWDEIARAAPAWRTDEARITDMAASISGFAKTVTAMQAMLNDRASDEAAPAAAARLARRLAAARGAANRHKDLTNDIAGHETAAEAARRNLTDAENRLSDLRHLAGVADDDALRQAIERSHQRNAAEDAIAKATQTLLAQGDGMAEVALRTEAAGIDPDQAAARLEAIEREATTLHARIDELASARTQAEANLEAMRKGNDAAAAAQAAEHALAEARTAAERYARLHVTRVLLRAAVERFRKERQDPLLRVAGAHFARLTAGRYRRLMAEQETRLLAVSDDGTECPVDALSEGTRDQLYLALRVAAIQAHAEHAEPLPFIADDLLVQFDNPRAEAAMGLLAELGRTTQVILFTHHDHIAALAQATPGVAVLELGGAEASARPQPALV